MDNRMMLEGIFYNESRSKELWLEWCKEATAVCDIGSNIGQFTLLALASNPKTVVYSIEPFLPNFNALKSNLLLNEGFLTRTHLIHGAVGNRRAHLDLFGNPDNPLTPSLIQKGNFISTGKVEVKPFMDWINAPLDAVKIDVEGAELEVIEGMLDYLKAHKPKILIEILDDKKLSAIQSLLVQMGYVMQKVTENEGASKNFIFIDQNNHH
jgi:FkbM family methyltransferase